MQQPSATTTAAPTTQDRATTFQTVEGGGNMQSGEKLLVEAYALIWILLMGYVFMVWRRQKSLHARIDELEKALDRAAALKRPEKGA